MPATVRVKALRNLRYQTRRMVAGDVFEGPKRPLTLLARIGHVEILPREAVPVPPPPPEVAASIGAAVSEVEALREEARARGVRVDLRWGAARLREELAKPEEPAES